MELNNLKPAKGSTHHDKRIGRGAGSGHGGEVKRFSRHDTSAALAKGLHEIKLVFLGHIIGGWPSNWNDGSVQLRKSDAEKFTPITAEMLSH